jgi:hypothetical protein
VTVSSEAKFPELETLATVINFSISRWKQMGGGGNAAPTAGTDVEEEDAFFITSVQEFDAGVSDGILLLDKDKRVKFVGRVLEDVLSLRNQYAQGQNITEACRDQSFAGTAVDMCDNVISSLGETQNAALDINGISRNIVAVAHRNRGGEIRFILMTVRMSG